ncbi:hypothetical protein A3764_01040 [Sulfitobacter sp. HI0129]|nr:hypothetical protein A3764_01040 [Sulfitobacter sp. HI0129]
MDQFPVTASALGLQAHGRFLTSRSKRYMMLSSLTNSASKPPPDQRARVLVLLVNRIGKRFEEFFVARTTRHLRVGRVRWARAAVDRSCAG